MYLSAFQMIAKEFGTTTPTVSLTLSSYFIGLAFGQLFYGPFLDRFGRKPPLYFGMAIYILASFACLSSHTIEALIVFRFFQAIGGCGAQVASLAMVRDFFEEKECPLVFSQLMLILSVSPLFAPTVGGFIAVAWGWKAVFLVLAAITFTILLVVFFSLPEGHKADETISLKPRKIGAEYFSISKNTQFLAYALSGAFSFAGLFAYLGAAPSIFMGTFHLTTKEFGGVFAFLSIGMVGGAQFNIWLSKLFSIEKIFRAALIVQFVVGTVFLFGSIFNWYGLVAHILIFYIYISCIGLTYPNAATLALSPFSKNRGSASALLGFLQMGIGALASAGFGLLKFPAAISLGIMFLAAAGLGLSNFIYLKKRHARKS
jgi:MFS transporter, DHA1 family, multidrug resistance protein